MDLVEQEKYNRLYKLRPRYGSDDHSKLVREYISGLEFHTLLDVGCGHAIFAAAMADVGKDVYAIDISEEAVKIASSRYPSLRVLHGSLTDIPFDRMFDLVTAFDVLEHVPEKDIDAAINALATHVGGSAIVSVAFHRDVLHGLDLHMCVHDEYWWVEQLFKVFNVVSVIGRKPRGVYLHLKSPKVRV